MFFTRRSVTVSIGSVCALMLAACSTPPQPAPAPTPTPPPVVVMPPPVVTPVPPVKPAPAPLMTPDTFTALPGWAEDDQREAWPALTRSCGVLARKPDWAAACAASASVDTRDLAAVRSYFESWFVPNTVRAADGSDTGLITGYYEPFLRGSRTRKGAYQTPLHRVPDDMLTVDLAGLYPELKGKRVRGRLAGNKVVPYAAREEIARGGLPGKELLWVDDPVEAFFLEVQGSGRVQLDNGDTVRVAYGDQNGHPYRAIGKWLLDQGHIPPGQVSAQSIKAWIAANPQRRQELFNVNPSYVFFKEERLPDPSIGPKGALGVPLVPARSVAIDPSFIPLGAPIYLSTTEAGSDVPMRRLMLAQDTGGAIRGEVRADFFFGFGPQAADNAGRMKQRGNVWVLLPRATPATPSTN